jgi:uncharacterized protein (TIGR02145 family)/uncharacterized repeat protein (TIGR02543 family)
MWDVEMGFVESAITLFAKWTLNTYTVTFNSQNGSAVNSQNIALGGKATSPANPTRTGYTFGGWYKEDTYTTQWNFDTDVVTYAITLYAKWTHTVTFNSQRGSGVSSQSIEHGGKVTEPADPTRTGYTFGGWYKEAACANAWNFASDVVTSVTTLYAKWNKVPVVVETFEDSRDSKSYKKVTIGTQTWMAENLNYDGTDGGGSKIGVCLNNNEYNCDIYGRLYNWSTAMNSASTSNKVPSGVQGVCDKGWHIPSDAEWDMLMIAVGGSSTAGRELKSQNWTECGPSGSGKSFVCEDDFGFSALPGGNGYSDGSFAAAGIAGFWWSSTENSAYHAWEWSMLYHDEDVRRFYTDKTRQFSVRCVQD